MKKIIKVTSILAVLTILAFNTVSVQAKLQSSRKKSEDGITESTDNSDPVLDQALPEFPETIDLENFKRIDVKLLDPAKREGILDAKELHRNFKEINFDAFKNAIDGFNKIADRRDDLITIIDYTKPSVEERFYVLDLKKRKIIYKSHVAHGRNSGNNLTTSFSNNLNSYQSSHGFFKTAETYNGSNGYSLRLDGLEPGINDNARARAIVIHGASYANPRKAFGPNDRLGRSLGCPALPTALNKKVIDTIKNGTLIYAHSNETRYTLESSILNS